MRIYEVDERETGWSSLCMARKVRVEFPGAIYHVMSRGDRGGDIFVDDVDRQEFLKTLAEACHKTAWEMHAYCLMRNHFHLVLETPNGDLVAGMRWMLGAYTIRLNRRHRLFGHVFSGRYKAVVIDGEDRGYLRTACDYVHLNPVRARLLKPEARLIAYPWSSLVWYLAAREHRPAWMRVDRVLGEHGIKKDTAEGALKYERVLEKRRTAEMTEEELAPLRRGWCFGGEEFKKQLLAQMDGRLGDNHSGELRRESAEVKAERIIKEELRRLGWREGDLERHARSDPGKLALAARLRKETTLTLRWITGRLHLGTRKSANARLHAWIKSQSGTSPPSRKKQRASTRKASRA